MPIYEYECEECHYICEQLLMSKEIICVCPNCGKVDTLRKIISKTSFRLKGEGWADSGYSKKSKKDIKNEIHKDD